MTVRVLPPIRIIPMYEIKTCPFCGGEPELIDGMT